MDPDPKTGLMQAIAALRAFGRAFGGSQRRKSGMTRRGAKHNHRPTWLPGKPMNGTPAQYRRAHRGNPKKAAYEKERVEKRKWISQK